MYFRPIGVVTLASTVTHSRTFVGSRHTVVTNESAYSPASWYFPGAHGVHLELPAAVCAALESTNSFSTHVIQFKFRSKIADAAFVTRLPNSSVDCTDKRSHSRELTLSLRS
jgi:hypothetical protein